MSLFTNKITAGNTGILADRARNLAEQAKLEQETLVGNKKREVLRLEQELDKLTDLAPDNTTSLTPGGKDFNAADWVGKLHNVKIKLIEAQVHLQAAEETLATWFSEDDKPAKQAAKPAK